MTLRLCEKFLFIFLISLGSLARAQAPIEEVLVTGEHPGPGLWKVSRGDNTLWILGTHAPLPTRLTWRSQQVEWVMTEAQQVIGPYSAAISLRGGDPFATDGPPLRKVLSRRQYAQWRALKQKYIGENDALERALPVTAALVLRSAAFERAGLTNADQVWRQIYVLAERYGVPVSAAHQLDKEIDWDERRDAERAQRVGVEFLVTAMSSLEEDLRAARTRANAWATGDLEALRGQAAADRDLAYLYAGSWPFLEDAELASMLASADTRWLAAAERALKRNRTTLAALPIFMLLREDGLVKSLRALGYEVDEPKP